MKITRQLGLLLVLCCISKTSFAPHDRSGTTFLGLDNVEYSINPSAASFDQKPRRELLKFLRDQIYHYGGGMYDSSLSVQAGKQPLLAIEERIDKMEKTWHEIFELTNRPGRYNDHAERPGMSRLDEMIEEEKGNLAYQMERTRWYQNELNPPAGYVRKTRDFDEKTKESYQYRYDLYKKRWAESNETTRKLMHYKTLEAGFPNLVRRVVDEVFLKAAKNLSTNRAAVYKPEMILAIRKRIQEDPGFAQKVVDEMVSTRPSGTRVLSLGSADAVAVFEHAARKLSPDYGKIQAVEWVCGKGERGDKRYPLSELGRLHMLTALPQLSGAKYHDFDFYGVPSDQTGSEIAKLPPDLAAAAGKAQPPDARKMPKPGELPWGSGTEPSCDPRVLSALRPPR